MPAPWAVEPRGEAQIPHCKHRCQRAGGGRSARCVAVRGQLAPLESASREVRAPAARLGCRRVLRVRLCGLGAHRYSRRGGELPRQLRGWSEFGDASHWSDAVGDYVFARCSDCVSRCASMVALSFALPACYCSVEQLRPREASWYHVNGAAISLAYGRCGASLIAERSQSGIDSCVPAVWVSCRSHGWGRRYYA